MFIFRIVKILLVFYAYLGCRSPQTNCSPADCYSVYFTNSSSTLPWDSCQTIASLHAPWEGNRQDKTTFGAFYNEASFIFRFRVEDSSIAVVGSDAESDVALGDRVELFFAQDASLNNYYCLEMSPNGRTLDYHASFYRKFDDEWNLDGLQIQSSKSNSGYTVTGIIPIVFFQQLTNTISLKGEKVKIGIFRAEKRTVEQSEDFSWYSWISPQSKHPDFHISSAFGTLSF